MHLILDNVDGNSGHIQAFMPAMRQPGHRSLENPKCADEPCRLVRHEAYANAAKARARMQPSQHLAWRETAAPPMDNSRQVIAYSDFQLNV